MEDESRSPDRGMNATMVAIIVLIVILGIGAAIAIPICAKVPEMARRANCKSNCHMIITAIHNYADDHNDSFPAAAPQQLGRDPVRSIDSLKMLIDMKYIEQPNVFHCPSSTDNVQYLAGRSNIAYTGNPSNAGSYAYDPRHVTKHPSTVALIGDRPSDNLPRPWSHGGEGGNFAILGTTVEWKKTPSTGRKLAYDSSVDDDIWTANPNPKVVSDTCLKFCNWANGARMNNEPETGDRDRRAPISLGAVILIVAIVCIGIALILPFMFRANEMARRAGCKGNCRIIITAIHNYADDHNDTFPAAAPQQLGRDPVRSIDSLKMLITQQYIDQPNVFRCASSGDNVNYLIGREPRPTFGRRSNAGSYSYDPRHVEAHPSTVVLIGDRPSDTLPRPWSHRGEVGNFGILGTTVETKKIPTTGRKLAYDPTVDDDIWTTAPGSNAWTDTCLKFN